MNNPETPSGSPKRVLVIDDQILFREGLISLMPTTTDFEAVGGAGSVHEGIEMAMELKPDIILMDFSLPDGTGLDATSVLMRQMPDCKIIFLTVYETDENLFAALRLGAKGYMLKNVTSSDLLASLRALNRGEKAISRHMMSSVLDEFSRIQPASTTHEKLLTRLSPRELDVLKEGKENNQGVGYLADGTMVVVAGGIGYIGRRIHVKVTSILQTSAGRIIFTEPKK